MIGELIKNIPVVALIFSAASLALVGVMFSTFLTPKLKKLDKLESDFRKLETAYDTLKVPENLSALQRLQTDVAVLGRSEELRNARLNEAIEAQKRSIEGLEAVIDQKVRDGDNHHLSRYLSWRVDQTETAYSLSRLIGGVREEDARQKWSEAKEALAQFRAAEQKSEPPTQ
jgi:hypothetical protein